MKRIGKLTHEGRNYIIYAALEPESPDVSRTNRCIWLRFENLIENHFKEQRRKIFYTDKLNISPSKLERLCKQNSGLSPSAYLLRRILREAEHLLADSSMQIKEISYSLGFAQQSHFTQYFRLYKGKSPGQFRANLQNTPQ
ncbi:helix-turn-helix domain-containing protein [Pedobacter aquatilis]|uniref:helix-turn-helix domain-containing protein n=1 Tax=Pedobacter aquatilis TaxID=351343 RepID=UPI00292E042E|nr:helix-turn-helix domain-containing protein [Pedobacter aquatilis]